MRSHRWQPTRLPRPWDSPGKSTGVGCHFLLQCMKVKSQSEVTQSCPTLSNPMDCSLPGSSVQGIFQARVLEWGAIAFSNISKLLRTTNQQPSARLPAVANQMISSFVSALFPPQSTLPLVCRGLLTTSALVLLSWNWFLTKLLKIIICFSLSFNCSDVWVVISINGHSTSDHSALN